MRKIYKMLKDFKTEAAESKERNNNYYGRLSRYADPIKQEQEEGAYERAVAEKYKEPD